MYQENGIPVTEKRWSCEMFEQWLRKFQVEVNTLLESNKL